jgi:hypothetical protein
MRSAAIMDCAIFSDVVARDILPTTWQIMRELCVQGKAAAVRRKCAIAKSTLRVSNLVEKSCLTFRYVVDIARYRSKGGGPGGLSSLLQYQ